MQWRLIITGCGTSHGNPPWGFPQAWSADPRDHRRRSGAALIGPEGKVVLFDCGPDLRQQCLDPYRNWDGLSYPEHCLTRCDAVLVTHTHADHSHGINELRHLNRLMGGEPITLFGHAPHLDELRATFPYCFASGAEDSYDFARPRIHTAAIDDGLAFSCAGLSCLPVPISHGPAGRVTAFRIGDFAYCTDCKAIDEQWDQQLQGLDLLVLGMLREKDHPTHATRLEALAIIERLQPQRTLLVHMGHEVRYREWQDERLPANVALAYDGWHCDLDL